MDDRDIGFEDYWHYAEPRKPNNELYMAGWTDAMAQQVLDDEELDDDDGPPWDSDAGPESF